MSVEKKYTQEEIRAIVDEVIRKQNNELGPEELEASAEAMIQI